MKKLEVIEYMKEKGVLLMAKDGEFMPKVVYRAEDGDNQLFFVKSFDNATILNEDVVKSGIETGALIMEGGEQLFTLNASGKEVADTLLPLDKAEAIMYQYIELGYDDAHLNEVTA